MKPIDSYLKSRGIDITTISGELYHKLEEYHTNWAEYNKMASLVLMEKSYSPYSDDRRSLYFSSQAERNKAMLEDEVAKILGNSRKR